MLTLTSNAENAIREILTASPLPEGAGVRIAAEQPSDGAESPRFQLSLVGEPHPADQLLEDVDVPVYVGPEAAPLLEDSVLDAEVESDRVTFSVGPG